MSDASSPPSPLQGGRLLAVLGAPTLGLALAVTTVASLLPLLLLEERAGPLVAGAFIASEGIFALTVPGPVGAWSDRLGTRLPFVLVAAPLGAAALVLLPFAGSLWLAGLALAAFFCAYYVFFAPYMALYPDLVPDDQTGRSQGSLGLYRAVGLGGALVAGGLLLSIWRPLPFIVAAVVLLVATAVFAYKVRGHRSAPTGGRTGAAGAGGGVRTLWRERPDVRRVLVANALWETALNGLRAFAILFITVGLGRSESFASLVFGGVAIAALIGAPLSGRLADRMGPTRVMKLALWVYAGGMVLPLLSQDLLIVAGVAPGVVAAVVVMTLPYGLLMERMPGTDHGAAAGLFAVSRGAGLLAGPLLAGLAVQLSESLLTDTRGYAAIFGVSAVALLLSIPVLGGIKAGSPRPSQPRSGRPDTAPAGAP